MEEDGMTEEEMDEYAEHAAAGYDRWQKLVKGHAVSDEEFARFLMWKCNDLVRRRGKEWVKARLDKGVEYYTQRLGDGKWLKEFERAHRTHFKD